jgi:hypothetical protein
MIRLFGIPAPRVITIALVALACGGDDRLSPDSITASIDSIAFSSDSITSSDDDDEEDEDRNRVSSVTVSPNTIRLTPGEFGTATAVVRNRQGEELSRPVTWTSRDTTIVQATSDSQTTQLTAQKVGSAWVTARVRRRRDSLRVIVAASDDPAPPVSAIILTPATVSVPTGGTQEFNATAERNDGTTTPADVVYEATGGSIANDGVYTAGDTEGTYQVIATQAGETLADTSIVTVTASSTEPSVKAIVLTPATVSLPAGGTQDFDATAELSDGTTAAADVSYQVTGGSISNGGVYTAGQTAGTYRVIATQTGGTLADTADVIVTATQPPSPPPSGSCVREVPVSTVSGLTEAVNAALPGDCIRAAAGTYALGVATWSRSGTASQPITLEGTGSSTVFTLGGNGGIYLKASYWRIRKLRITEGFFGIQLEASAHTELDSLEIDHLKQAAINLFYGTHHAVIRNSWIHDTGIQTARYGEGVYIGGYATSARTSVDELADDQQILDNRFGPNVRAEAIDVSRGADRLIARRNTIDGTGTVYEANAMASVVAVRGAGHVIEDNVLSKGAPHGMIVWEGSATFRRNRIALFNQANHPAPVGIYRSSGTVTVSCDNVVTDIPAGGAAFNVPCTP